MTTDTKSPEAEAYAAGWAASKRTRTFDLDAAEARYEARHGRDHGGSMFAAGWVDYAAESTYGASLTEVDQAPADDLHPFPVCECCALMIANGDESGCRDYYGHTHAARNVHPSTCITDDGADQPSSPWTCEACGERQERYAYRMWAVTLAPATTAGAGMTTTTQPQPTNLDGWGVGDVYRLARLACVLDPDGDSSPGAVFLISAANDQGEILARVAEGEDLGDVIHEVADSSVPVYNFDRSRIWNDLGVWAADIDTDDLYPAEGSTTIERMGVDLFAVLINLLTALTEPVATCSECGQVSDDLYMGLCPSCVHDARRSGWEG